MSIPSIGSFLLDKVREIKINPRITPTVSIGVASGMKTLSEMAQKAQSCLDLALGRGGDQAVVSIGEEVSFYGARGSVQAKIPACGPGLSPRPFTNL